ncbi:MAG: hypothetical protein J7L50_01175 [Candidatus Odinarchaeota archaeon]|nr:hypothetical protein [Candidatus Odinarchaeota archaeon]
MSKIPDVGRKLSELKGLLGTSYTKSVIFEALLDGEWHDAMDLWRIGKSENPNIGLLTVGVIMDEIKSVLGDIIEEDLSKDVKSWRIRSEYLEVLKNYFRSQISKILRDRNLAAKGLFF